MSGKDEEPLTYQGVPFSTLPHFVNADGKYIFCKYWEPKLENGEEIRALVYVCHGAGEHCLWYDCFAQPLLQQKCLMFSHDHVGHGQSQGDRIHVEEFSEYVRDVIQHVTVVKEKHPNMPVFCIAHSMGGTIALRTALDNPSLFQGMVLIAPVVVPKSEAASPLLIWLARVIVWFAPQYQISKLCIDHVSRDPVLNKKYEDDPLIWHGGLKTHWALSLIDTLLEMEPNLSKLTVPFITLHGDDDKIVDIESSRVLAEKAGSRDKTFKVYEGYYHQLHNDTPEAFPIVCKDIMDWLLPRMDSATQRINKNGSA